MEMTETSTESMEQQGLVKWFRLRFPGIVIFSVPNGDWRGVSVGRRLKAEGLTPGVPDLFIPAWHCFVEMKRTKGGKLSSEQVKMIEYLKRVGYEVIIGYGAEDASRKLLEMKK